MSGLSARNDSGSSPRAWGIQPYILLDGIAVRFIPTCVGNTRGQQHQKPDGSVHPHVRGEYAVEVFRLLAPDRFIPTCVGNTIFRISLKMFCAVHPHVRGEYENEFHSLGHELGSSPRAWGIRSGSSQGYLSIRFIPTCVGNTKDLLFAVAQWSVHPHVRGEYEVPCRSASSVSGSSPRAWGIQIAKRKLVLSARFIPTCVGNTGHIFGCMPSRAVHPHVRGEYMPISTPRKPKNGSSPRAWGIHYQRAT